MREYDRVVRESRLDEDDGLEAVVARGHADGSIDSQLPSVWINALLGSMLDSVNALYQHSSMTLGQARALMLRTLEKSLCRLMILRVTSSGLARSSP